MSLLAVPTTSIVNEYGRGKLWTRDETDRLSELFPEQKLELIEGVLINKMGQNPLHATIIAIVNQILTELYRGKVRCQLSIALPDPEGVYSEPEPDFAILHENVIAFAERHPNPDDILLLIEIADTTLDSDWNVKGPLYARCGIANYWLLDARGDRIVWFREPKDGLYQVQQVFGMVEQIQLPEGPMIPVARLFGK
jgi:hypothetical protein